MNPIILDTMNDIINQVETREWNRVNEHRERLVKKMKNQNQKVQEMKDDWEVATEKIGQENSDLHNEIKRLKNEMKLLKDVNKAHLQRLEHMEKSKSGIRYKQLLDENEKLKSENYRMTSKIAGLQKRNESLQDILSY